MDQPNQGLGDDLAAHGETVEQLLSGTQWLTLGISLLAPGLAAGMLAPVVTQYGESAVGVFFATFVWSGAILALTVIVQITEIHNVWAILSIAAGSVIGAAIVGALIGAPVLQANDLIIGPIRGSPEGMGLLIFFYFFANVVLAAYTTFGFLGMLLGVVVGVGWGEVISNHIKIRRNRRAALAQAQREAQVQRMKAEQNPPQEDPPMVQF